MTNVSTVEVAARAAAPPKKSESVQTPKGDDGFKKCLEACAQEAEPEMEAETTVEEAVINAAQAAAVLLQMSPVQVETVQTATPKAATEVVNPTPVAPQPVTMEAPVEQPNTVKAEAKVEAAPVNVETTAPVKTEAKTETAPFSAVLNTAAEADQPVEIKAPVVTPKTETLPTTPVQVKPVAAEVVVEQKPVVKVQPVEVVETVNTQAPVDNVTARVSVDLNGVPTEARPAHLAQHLSAEINFAAASGKNSIHIQIQPENMGRIDVRLVSNSDGMQVVLTTDSSATGKLLENNLNQLQKSLADAGLTVSGLSVNSQGLQGQFANNFQDQKFIQSHRFVNRSTIAAMPVEAIAATYSNQISGLDFRI